MAGGGGSARSGIVAVGLAFDDGRPAAAITIWRRRRFDLKPFLLAALVRHRLAPSFRLSYRRAGD
jgi:hypothetical protein